MTNEAICFLEYFAMDAGSPVLLRLAEDNPEAVSGPNQSGMPSKRMCSSLDACSYISILLQLPREPGSCSSENSELSWRQKRGVIFIFVCRSFKKNL